MTPVWNSSGGKPAAGPSRADKTRTEALLRETVRQSRQVLRPQRMAQPTHPLTGHHLPQKSRTHAHLSNSSNLTSRQTPHEPLPPHHPDPVKPNQAHNDQKRATMQGEAVEAPLASEFGIFLVHFTFRSLHAASQPDSRVLRHSVNFARTPEWPRRAPIMRQFLLIGLLLSSIAAAQANALRLLDNPFRSHGHWAPSFQEHDRSQIGVWPYPVNIQHRSFEWRVPPSVPDHCYPCRDQAVILKETNPWSTEHFGQR